MRFIFVRQSSNMKTGPIPVTITSSDTCPDACPLKGGACYAKHGHLAIHWRRTDASGIDLDQMCQEIEKLPRGQIWRHNQAGDLPGEGDRLDLDAFCKIVSANIGRRGFTYTHKPLDLIEEQAAVAGANALGFTVNLSANNLSHADELADMGIGPVVTVLPPDVSGNDRGISTPAGRKVVVCPATYRKDVTCKTCALCQRADRRVIVGFPLHGQGKKKWQGKVTWE